ncbi:MAG: hypothetical protein JW772_03265 [Candidatus Diapherotrites archaeon]|nr:hypothetical protein [Candidatus Diapherotrites archaeon]
MGVSSLASARRMLEKRLQFGKKIIDSETKPMDLVMIEQPVPTTYAQFLDGLDAVPEEAKKGSLVHKIWRECAEFSGNFYFKLAEYARAKGRRVESLESGLTQRPSRLQRAYTHLDLLDSEKAHRVEYLFHFRRHASMEARIQSKKPNLVIAASGHAMLFEQKFHPRKTIYNLPEFNAPERKAEIARRRRTAVHRHNLEKAARRKNALSSGHRKK